MNPLGTVCVFAKATVPGIVKTRLIPSVGAEGAAALSRAFFQDTWSEVCGLGWAYAAVATTSGSSRSALLDEGPAVWMQGEGDLGQRMERVLGRALAMGGFAIAIGADSPGLPARFLEEARTALATADAVLGPAEDGGFYLLGLRRAPPGLLRGIPWSRPDTFDRTLDRLREEGLTVRILAPWFDVDRPEDLRRLRGLLCRGELHAPQTTLVLDRLLDPCPG